MSAFISTAKRAGGFVWCGVAFMVLLLGAGVAEGRGQDLPTAVPALTPTRLDLYGGYAYFRPIGGTIATRRYDAIQLGGVGSATYYFNRYFGAQVEGSGSPQGRNDSVYTAEAGGVVRYPYGRFSPFIHVLGGVVRQRGPALQPPTYGWAATGGAGVDYVVPGFQHQLALRLAQADFEYTHVDYGKLALPGGYTGGLGEIRAYRLSAGVVFRFGGGVQSQERPLMYSCAASPVTIFAGDPIIVTGTTVGASMGKRSLYTWATNGGQISGTEETANISTTGLAPGEYTITGHISQGRHAGEIAECTTSYTVQAPQPPTISCSANPLSVSPGGKVTITSQANSPQGRPLRFSYSASAGQIANTLSVATLDTANAPPGALNVECRVGDDQGQSATAVATVNVVAPLPAAVAERRDLCSLNFARDRKRPVRVDNEAKACLDDVALTLNREATARLEITGERSDDEAAGQASARAMNASQYLTGEKGIDPARIDIKAGTIPGRTVEIELLPIGTPIRYSDGSVGTRVSPGARLTLSGTTDEVTMPAPVVEGPGSAGTRRPADSLVLPPLPDDAVAKTAPRPQKRVVKRNKRRRRHKSAAPTTSVSPATGGVR